MLKLIILILNDSNTNPVKGIDINKIISKICEIFFKQVADFQFLNNFFIKNPYNLW